MAVGGLGVVLYGGRAPLAALSKVDLQSVFFATVFVIIVLVLGAYRVLVGRGLTNAVRHPCFCSQS